MKSLESARVLIWAKEPAALAVVEETLLRLGSRVQAVDSLERLRQAIRVYPVDIIVAQVSHRFREPLELLARSRDVEGFPPMLLVATTHDVQLYLEGMRRGAFDCLGLPLDEKELVRIVSHALEARHLTPCS
jgi:DNA-binding NtrC family response regulator